MKVLITAGPTREALDPVRFLSNRSSGKMGYALAFAAQAAGHDVTVISGPVSIDPKQLHVVSAVTARDMHREVMARAAEHDVLIMAAAVSDYRPEVCLTQKMKKTDGDLELKLVRNPDILLELSQQKMGCFVVGFAAESEDLLCNAQNKMRAKSMQMIVANDIMAPGAGFEGDTNIVYLLYRDGRQEAFPKMDKLELAQVLIKRIEEEVLHGARVRS